MPLDAVCLSALKRELEEALTGARVDKIYMPGREDVHLALRAPVGHVRLLLSSGNNHPRVHLTEAARENPATPPMFCMLLRKHLSGARLLSIEQPALERVLRFHFDAADEMGAIVRKTLVCEMMGRHSNIILCGPDERIIDCLRRVDAEMSERRQVLPGFFYHWPPGQDKQNPLETEEAVWRAMVMAAPPDTVWADWLLARFAGIPPLICRELEARRAQDTPEAFLAQVLAWRQLVLSGDFAPWLVAGEDSPVDFSYMPITQYGDRYQLTRAGSFSELLDSFYAARDLRDHLKVRAQDMLKLMTTLRDRARRKLAAQRKEWEQTQQRERLRECGDLLMANLHTLKKGVGAVTVFDFYHNEDAEIRVNPLLTPQQNAARYYKDYQRAKTAEQTLSAQMAQGEAEILYLESVLEALGRTASSQDVEEIRQELTQGGYLRQVRGKRPVKPLAAQPVRFVSSTGVPILAGRNNRQNDQLTLKMASKGDLWLHTQKIPGSHVVVLTGGGPPDDTTLGEAAQLAATLSQAAQSPKVPVDYTKVAYVKKPPGAKPGMVIYDNFKTILARPDKALLERLRVK